MVNISFLLPGIILYVRPEGFRENKEAQESFTVNRNVNYTSHDNNHESSESDDNDEIFKNPNRQRLVEDDETDSDDTCSSSTNSAEHCNHLTN